MLQIEKIIKDLSSKQPIFHSEADFQHALAWEIHNCYPTATVRLEIHPGRIGKREYIDIWVKYNNKIYAIELKYKTRKIDINYNGEIFYLLNQSAQDVGRYDFIKDIARLERFTSAHPNAIGYAIILTNDSNYWKPSRRNDTVDSAFRIHEGRKLSGKLRWSRKASKGTKKSREKTLTLRSPYPLRWTDYSKLSGTGPNQFQYLILKIQPNKA